MTDHFNRFIDSFGVLQKYLLADAEKNMMLTAHRKEYVKKMLDVTCLGGKYTRGVSVVNVVDALSAGVEGEDREKLLFEACVCGWMNELLQAHFLVEDDIMDDSITRRDKPCWFRFPGVTMQSAINDGLIVFAMATELAMHYFEGKPATLLTILKEFHRADYHTTMGQLYDVTSMRNGDEIDPEVEQKVTTDFKEFVFESFERIVKHKTAYYTFHLPLALGIAVCKHIPGVDAIAGEDVEKIAMLMGEYFQAQDDFMDCFTDPVKLGKVGTDIEDMKCGWLAVSFLAVATEEQRATFAAHYGKHDKEDVAIIKQLYVDTDMKGAFAAYEAQIAEKVEKVLADICTKHEGFATACRTLWNKTYKRTK